MHRRYPITGLAIAAAALGGGAGCGGGLEQRVAVTTTPAAQRSVQEGGAITVRGDYGPDEHGPYVLHGTYHASFVQRGAGVDWATEVPFTAHLEQAVASGPARTIPLFERSAQRGSATVSAEGRWKIVVDYGDSPYEIALTPAR